MSRPPRPIQRHRSGWRHRGAARFIPSVVRTALLGLVGCTISPPLPETDPFADLRPVPLDGTARTIRGNAAALGMRRAGEGLSLRVEVPDEGSFMILRRESPDTALYIGGGPTGADVEFAVTADGEHIVLVPTLDASGDAPRMNVAAQLLLEPPARPPGQAVRIVFEPGFLTDPGLLDPVDGTDADRAVLESLSDTVQRDVLKMLRAIFTDTPIYILGPEDPAPDEPLSTLAFSPQRVLAADQDIHDAALPALDPARPQCQVRVLFGEVLPRGVRQDAGNRVRDDAAVVYVGSFQGRGRDCWSAVINSTANIVFALAQTAAHEIGHLVGLTHVEQIDLMNGSATLALFRVLELMRGQVQVERTANGSTVTEVFTAVIQDPAVYFSSVFDAPPLIP